MGRRPASSEPRKKRRPKVTISKYPVVPVVAERDEENYSFHSMLRNNHALPTEKRPLEKASAKGAKPQIIPGSVAPPPASPPPSPPQSDVEVEDDRVALIPATAPEKSVPIENDGSILGTWRGYSASNGVEIVRGEMGGVEVAIYRVRDSGIALGGSGWMRVLQGNACLLGATLDAYSPSFFITSVPLAPFAVVVHPADPANANNISNGKERVDEEDWLKKICDDNITNISLDLECNAGECIVVFAESTPQDVPRNLEFYIPRSGLPACPDGWGIVRGLSLLRANAKIPCLKLWPNWGDAASSIDTAEDVRVLVCGASGTGKSIAVRCMLNHLLSSATCREEVVLIDTDVGQPEMNIPGLVAAHSVRRTRPGATCARNRNVPICARFVGNVTPRDDPALYTECINHVIQEGLNYAAGKGYPVIINSDGWIADTGADLLRIVVDEARPSHVVAMAFPDKAKDTVISQVLSSVPEGMSHEFVSPLSGRTSFYSGSLLRDLSIAAYFSGALNSGAVYELSLDAVSFAIETIGEHVSVLPNCPETYAALNACILALCTCEGDVLGFGIVRGVDADLGCVYITTPICDMHHTLETKCERLIISKGIQVPASLFLALADRAPQAIKAPYVEVNVVTNGGQIKSRPNIARKSLAAV